VVFSSVSSWLRAWPIALFLSLGATPALAQSAADKSTARRLATQGIELHGQGKYAEALDRLQRAQELYDAPVHLLYIARSQTKLNQFVEASETYRRLTRLELAPNAPAAFRDAVEAGKREAPDVEGRIAGLRVETEPPGAPGLQLFIDEQEVSSAVVGVERPINPGSHRVRASAAGYEPAEATVELAEAEKKTIRLELVASESAAAAGSDSPGGASTDRSAAASTDAGVSSKEDPESNWKALHLFAGLRIGAAFPGGNLYRAGGTDVAMSDYFATGAGVELHAGAWFAGYFGAKLFVEGYAFDGGPALDRMREFDGIVDARVENSPTGHGIGVAALIGTPLRRWGVFGEVGMSFAQQFTVKRRFDAQPNACGSTFEQELAFSGAALRLGVGARIPASSLVQLTPYFLTSLGKASKVSNDSSCSLLANSADWPASGDLSDGGVHRLILVGLGGDLLFGLR